MQRLDLLVTRHFPRQAGKMRFAYGEQPWPTTGSKRDACCPRLSAKIDNMLVSLMRIAPKGAKLLLPIQFHEQVTANALASELN